jgi:hypothetical protein
VRAHRNHTSRIPRDREARPSLDEVLTLCRDRIVLRVSAVDDYFGGLDASQRAAFEHIRNLVMDMVPEAE